MADITVILAVRCDPDAMSLTPAEHLALSMRSHATASGECVCGAVARYDEADQFTTMVMEHEDDCPCVATAADTGTAKVLRQLFHRILDERPKLT